MFQNMGFNEMQEGHTAAGEIYIHLQDNERRAHFQPIKDAEKGIIGGTCATAFGKNRNEALSALAANFRKNATGENCMVVVSGQSGNIDSYVCYQSSSNGNAETVLEKDFAL